MDQARTIGMGLGYAGKLKVDLANALGMTKQAFYMKIKRGSFTDTELDAIAEALGLRHEHYFELPDGRRI